MGCGEQATGIVAYDGWRNAIRHDLDSTDDNHDQQQNDMTAPDLMDPFHRELYKRLVEEINDATVSLAGGSAAQVLGDTITVAEKYAAQVSKITTYRKVLEICEDLEQERYGGRPKAPEPGDA